MPVIVPAGAIIQQDQDGHYAVLPDGTIKRISVAMDDGKPILISTRILRDGTVEIESQNGDQANQK